jgi:hypothetical protein
MERKPFPDLLHTTPEEKAAAAARDTAEVEVELAKMAWFGRFMDRSILIGMMLTETVADHALGDAMPPMVPEEERLPRAKPEVAARWVTEVNVALTYERLTRTVRTSIMTSSDLFVRRRALAQTINPAGMPGSRIMLDRQKRVGQVVRAALAEQIVSVADPADHETLFREADEWLEDPSVISALGEVPYGKIVASLIECMGYRPSLRQYSDEDLGIHIPWVKPERPLGASPLPQDQLPSSKVHWSQSPEGRSDD